MTRRGSPRSREVLCGQQLGSKRLERLRSTMRVAPEQLRKTARSEGSRALRRPPSDPRTGLSRRRSRVQVPSLQSTEAPANRYVLLSVRARKSAAWPNRGPLLRGKIPAKLQLNEGLVARSHEHEPVIAFSLPALTKRTRGSADAQLTRRPAVGDHADVAADQPPSATVPTKAAVAAYTTECVPNASPPI